MRRTTAAALCVVILGIYGLTRQSTPATITPTPARSPGTPIPAAAPTPVPDLPSVGSTMQLQGWRVSLSEFGLYEKVVGSQQTTASQGILLVAKMTIWNVQNSTSNFTATDFALQSGDGREFKPAAQTASVPGGFVFTQTVQPGLGTVNNVVFDIDPAARDLVLTALKIQFRAPWSAQDQAALQSARETRVAQATVAAQKLEKDMEQINTNFAGTMQAINTSSANLQATGISRQNITPTADATLQAIRASSTNAIATSQAVQDKFKPTLDAIQTQFPAR